jgi:uncharacterized protein
MNTNIPSDVPQSPVSVSAEDRNWATIGHLSALAAFIVPFFGGILGPLVVWLIKKEQSAYAADAAKEALNFNITVAIGFIISACLMIVFIGFLLIAVLGIAWLVLVIIAGVKSSEGKVYRYPFTFRFIS